MVPRLFLSLPILLTLSDIASEIAMGDIEIADECHEYLVRVESIQDCNCVWKKDIFIEVMNREENVKKTISYANRTVDVEGLYLLPNDRLLSVGALGSGGQILTLLNLETGDEVDNMWVSSYSLSPKRNVVAFLHRYPPSGALPKVSDVLLIYDFQVSIEDNSMDRSVLEVDSAFDAAEKSQNRGIAVYPEEAWKTRSHALLAVSQANQVDVISPLLWRTNEELLFLEMEGEVLNLIQARFNDSYFHPKINKREVDKSQFYQDDVPEHDYRPIPIKEFEFTDDKRFVIVRAWAMGPFLSEPRRIAIDPY